MRIAVGVVMLVALTFGAALWQRQLWRRELERRRIAALLASAGYLFDWQGFTAALTSLGFTAAEVGEGFRKIAEALRDASDSMSEGRGKL